MRVFVTGASGFIGSAVTKELVSAGHKVLGMARSDAGARTVTAAGGEVHRGDLEDLDSLKRGAAASDGVIHCAFIHDAFTGGGFDRFKKVCQIDRRAIEALGAVLAGSDRPLIVTGGTGPMSPGRPLTEDIDPPANSPMPRVSEETAMSLRSKGVSSAVMRLPQVHDTVKQGLVTYLIATARQKGVSAYVGDGSNRWPAAHVLDVARLYRLALEKHEAGAKYHAVAEEGVPLKDIAEAIGKGLRVPVVSVSQEEAVAHLGWLAMFAGLDIPASSVQTQERLGWKPTHTGLIDDLNHMQYVESAVAS